ncbi:MAG: glycosyltransferase [Sphingobium sp.]
MVHPDADHFLCLADEVVDVDGYYPDDCTLVTVDSLDIPDFHGFAFRYDIMEFNTAAKPYMILHLFAMGYENVIYFDPDIKVYRPISPVFDALAAGASVVLTPHLTRPAESDTPPDDITIMKAGIYNLGFVAFGRHEGVESVLRWWARRLRYQCINAQGEGIFVDQKFVDLVPGFLSDVVVLRDTTLNVAYWNLFQRDFSYDGDHWQVDDEALLFFHFSGYDPRNSHQLSKHTPLFSRDNSPALNSLLDDYQADLFDRGLKQTPRANYAYDRFASGTRIPTFVRHLFRQQFLTWDGDPFKTFEDYLSQPAPSTAYVGDGSVCTNLMQYFREVQPYLAAHFDVAQPDGVARLTEWFIQHGHTSGIDPRLVHSSIDRITETRRARPQRIPTKTQVDTPDVSLIGYLKAGTGVGEAGRLTLRSLATGPYSVSAVDVALNVASSRNDTSCDRFIQDTATGRILIFNINADQLPLVQNHLPGLREDAYRISVPFWELAQFPDEWIAAFDGVDEIWAPTRFIQAALITKVRKPVLRMPIALDFSRPEGFDRKYFGLPKERFVFLFSFDFLSFSGRKNPMAVIDAFRFAFAGRSLRDDVVLVIKCVNVSFAPDELKVLRSSLTDGLDIRFIDRELSRAEMLGLVGAVDCVVSLHRSEGLGLLIAEAMALGVPVITTDYSATTELVSPATGYPVDFKLIPVPPGAYPHAHGQVWAEPDLSHAAWQMRYVVEQSGRNTALIDAARNHIRAEYGLAAVQQQQNARFEELGV